MNVKEPMKSICKYCKEILKDPQEIELNYHISCKKDIEEFQAEDIRIIEFLSRILSLPEDQIVTHLKHGDIKYILDNNKNIIELKIMSAVYVRGTGLNSSLFNNIDLPTTELQELRVLSFSYDNFGWEKDE